MKLDEKLSQLRALQETVGSASEHFAALLACVQTAARLRFLPSAHATGCAVHADRECGFCNCGFEEAREFSAALAALCKVK